MKRWTERAGAVWVAVETAEQERLERDLPDGPAGPPLLAGDVDGAQGPLVEGDWTEVKTLAVGVVEAVQTAQGEPVARTRE